MKRISAGNFWIVLGIVTVTACAAAFSAAFEDVGVGARGRGMGGAFTATADDATAIDWNPAALADIKKRELTIFDQDLYGLGLINYSFLGYVQPNIAQGSIGFGVIRLGTTGSVNFMNYTENTFIFSYGHALTPDFSIGANLKYFLVSYDVKAGGVGADLSGVYSLWDDTVRLAVLWKNLNNPVIRWETQAQDQMASTVHLGAQFAILDNQVLALEADQSVGQQSHLGLGWEGWFFNKILGLRAGAFEQDKHMNPSFGFSLGFGKFRFDYALERHYVLGYSSLLGLTVTF